MKRTIAILITLLLTLTSLTAFAELGAVDVTMDGDAYHLTLTDIGIADGRLAVTVEGFGDTLRMGANGWMVAAWPVARYGDEAVRADNVSATVGGPFVFTFERDALPDALWMDPFDEGEPEALIWRADGAAPEDAAEAVELMSPGVGDVVTFGHYEQDGDEADGPEPVEWIVLRIRDGGATLISKYALDAKPFSEDEARRTWDTCTLRDWLNGAFVDAAFTAEEQRLLKTVEVPADRNPLHRELDPGQDTRDRVYLLGYTESELLFASTKDRYCAATAYALAEGAFRNDDTGGTWWHLRSPGNQAGWCAGVDVTGKTSGYGSANSDVQAIRPVITLTVASPDSPEVTPTPTPTPSPTPAPTPTPTPVPADLAWMNGYYDRVKAGDVSEQSEDATVGDRCVIAVYSGEDDTCPQTSIRRDETGLDFSILPGDRLAASVEEADTLIIVYPEYEYVGAYQYLAAGMPLVRANATRTMVCLVDVRSDIIHVPSTLASNDPPQSVTIHYRDPAGISPIETHFDGEYEIQTAMEWIAEQMK